MDLKEIREELNTIDSSIIELLEKRYELVAQVAEYKARNDMQVFDGAREEEILQRVDRSVKNRLYAEYIVDTYSSIMGSSKNYQRAYLENIVLIGMPGSGKSTVGRKLAEKYGYKFIDADDEFTKQNGIPASKYITDFGEKKFREQETKVLETFKPFNRCVIAMGGGVVTVPDNFEIIKPLGVVIYIKRDLDKLASKGRPITASKGVEQLFAERSSLYELWSDGSVENVELAKTVDDVYSMIHG